MLVLVQHSLHTVFVWLVFPLCILYIYWAISVKWTLDSAPLQSYIIFLYYYFRLVLLCHIFAMTLYCFLCCIIFLHTYPYERVHMFYFLCCLMILTFPIVPFIINIVILWDFNRAPFSWEARRGSIEHFIVLFVRSSAFCVCSGSSVLKALPTCLYVGLWRTTLRPLPRPGYLGLRTPTPPQPFLKEQINQSQVLYKKVDCIFGKKINTQHFFIIFRLFFCWTMWTFCPSRKTFSVLFHQI